MNTQGIKKKREALWKSDPHCCYCGKMTILPSEQKIKPGEAVPLNTATLDHVYHVNHRLRDTDKFVLACCECNAYKSQIECQTQRDLIGHRNKAMKVLAIVNKMLEFEKDQI